MERQKVSGQGTDCTTRNENTLGKAAKCIIRWRQLVTTFIQAAVCIVLIPICMAAIIAAVAIICFVAKFIQEVKEQVEFQHEIKKSEGKTHEHGI